MMKKNLINTNSNRNLLVCEQGDDRGVFNKRLEAKNKNI